MWGFIANHQIQNKLYQYWGKWKLGYEVAMIALFCLYCLPFSFGSFIVSIYLPIMALLIPVIFLGRYLIARHEREETKEVIRDEKVTLLGENKLDILKVAMTNLVALEAANNYVAVHYLLDGRLKKKLLRSSLQNIHKTVPEMIQVHRSYLVNGQQVVEWKDSQTLVLTQFTVPVSHTYKAAALQLYEQGKLDLDEPIATYLPAYPTQDASRITTRQLSLHSSGIGAYQSRKETENKQEYASLTEAATVFQDRE